MLDVVTNNELIINSIDLVDIINKFREIEELDKIEHCDVIRYIDEEIEDLKYSKLNYNNLFFKDEDGSYFLTKSGVIEILLKVTISSRHYVLEYMKVLESDFRILQAQQYIREQERLRNQQ